MADLRAMLPATSTISDFQNTSAKIWNIERPSVEFNLNDGHGKADIQFGIYQPDFLSQNASDCKVPTAYAGPRPHGAPPVSCTRKVLPDGSLLYNIVTAADDWRFYGYQIDLVRPGQETIALGVGNGILPTTPGPSGIALPVVTRAVPPGSFAEWNAIVESPAWH